MIKPEQIPDELINKLYERYELSLSRGDLLHLITAAINAWPGAWGERDPASEWISLPLPEEKNDV